MYRYLYGRNSQPHLHKLGYFRTYMETCRVIVAHPAFGPVHESINHKMGKRVTPVRAVEIIMYTGGAPQPVSTIQEAASAVDNP